MINHFSTASSKAPPGHYADGERCTDAAGADLTDGLEAMSVAERYNRTIIRAFAPFLGDHVVEVGAGNGNVSLLLLERELTRLDAIEPDDVIYATLAERLRDRVRAKVHRGYLASVIRDPGIAEADSVVSVNVLEHVEEDEAELALMHSILRPGGHLCLWVPALPALNSQYDRSLGHYRRYRKRELAGKLSDAGFETLRIEYRDFVGMFVWFVCCRLLGMGLTSGRARFYDRLIVPITGSIERRLRLPIGKNLLALARRP